MIIPITKNPININPRRNELKFEVIAFIININNTLTLFEIPTNEK